MPVAGGCIDLNNVKIELSFICLIFILVHSLMLQNTEHISCQCVNNSSIFLCLLKQICNYIHFFFKYCLLAVRLKVTSVYNLICCLVVVSWKGDHPAMSPQSCRSAVHRVFSLLLLFGCVCVSTRVLGWDSNVLRCSVILSLTTSLT
jgi:hypothetical protein